MSECTPGRLICRWPSSTLLRAKLCRRSSRACNWMTWRAQPGGRYRLTPGLSSLAALRSPLKTSVMAATVSNRPIRLRLTSTAGSKFASNLPSAIRNPVLVDIGLRLGVWRPVIHTVAVPMGPQRLNLGLKAPDFLEAQARPTHPDLADAA